MQEGHRCNNQQQQRHTLRLRIDIMSALGGATFVMPKAKEGVELCMNVRQYTNPLGKLMYEVSCPLCIVKNSSSPKSWILEAKQGLGNAWVHFKGCVDNDAALKQMVTEARHAKAEEQRVAAAAKGGPPPPPSG